jgi:predicted MFS family arabinose efflux permease
MTSKANAWAALALLTGLNFVNYIDRSILFAVQELVKDEFHVNDKDIGFLTSAFFVCYMIAAPLITPLADRFPRKYIMGLGALVWSGATLLTAITHNYDELLLRHVVVGIGEATFVVFSPAFISDLFPEHQRGRALSIFYLAIPVGTAFGYIIGGKLGEAHGWRMPFLICALPGVLLALGVIALREPRRGASDHIADNQERGTILGLFRNKAYWTVSLGMAMMTFAVGGLQVWMPTFLTRVRGVPLGDANTVFGGLTVVSGTCATLLGGWLGDRLLKRTKAAYQLISAIGMLLSIPAMMVALFVAGPVMYPAIFAGEFLILLNTAPLNAALVNSVSARIRATAVAVNVFTIHLLGDAFSPTLIGAISDKTNLQTGFLAAVVAAGLSAAVLFYGMRFAPELPEEAPNHGALPEGAST